MGLYRALKTRFLVAAVTERLPLRSSAAAKSNLGAPAQSVGVAVLIHHIHHTVDQQRSIVHHCHFYIRHPILRSKLFYFLRACVNCFHASHSSNLCGSKPARLLHFSTWEPTDLLRRTTQGYHPSSSIPCESQRAAEIHGFGRALAAAAMRHNLSRPVEFAGAFGEITERNQVSAE